MCDLLTHNDPGCEGTKPVASEELCSLNEMMDTHRSEYVKEYDCCQEFIGQPDVVPCSMAQGNMFQE